MNKTPKKPEYKLINFKEISQDINQRIDKIEKEFKAGFDFIRNHPRSVTFFGSARTPSVDQDYITAEKLAGRICRELGYSVLTGGSVGIMEAANRGAFTAGGRSLGLNIKLPKEQKTNSFLTEALEFNYFFSRKVCLSFSAEAYVFFPGGFGTLDELFEILTLVQTKKIPSAPVILVGSYFWNNFDAFLRKNLLANKKISESDLSLYEITDDEDKIIEIIKSAPIRLED